MTLEEQRDYWEERYNIEKNNYNKLKEQLDDLIKEMYKNGSMYWARRLRELL